ncbi:21846_t:CDS:2 [Rhizophagus irregularis]|nr:21846_t:CDS:2 [Rhizophagus irregularis]
MLDEELFNIYIVPNFTTYAEKIEGKIEGKFGTILCWLRKILLLPGYKNLDYKGHKSFLYIESEDIIFDNPFIEASFNEINEINNQGIVILLTVTTLILWIEMLLWLRLFTEVAVYIYIFGNILKKIIPFFVFMIILTIGFGHSMFVLFGHPSLLDLNPSASTYTLDNGTTNLKLTGEIPVNPFDTIWDAILSAYY